ncbi:MAG: N-6 DNA methylase [Deltaproteobacteria bacterium]|nr:N-6 DNA methylase [Deltaproteobacteria bacterium]
MSARSPRRREAVLAFDALHIEGGLLAPEWLARAARLDAPHQAEADYRVPRGLQLRDEIGRAWRIAQAHHDDYRTGLARKADPTALSTRFVLGLLREVFGFRSLEVSPPLVVGDRSWPIGHAALGGRAPVVIAPAGAGLDAPHAIFGEAGRRRSPFGLLQEALNAAEGALWGLTCDGERLRVARDNASLTRPAWIEADLARIFAEDRFADFTALWLLVHESRFGQPDARPEDCPLEVWREAGRQEGTRALTQLRVGVKDALEALGQGFLAHPDNGALRARLEAGQLSRRALFQQLLRLVYRLIFLLTVEERGLLHPPGANAGALALYAEGYALRRLRERAVRRSAHDLHADLWEAQKIALRALDKGEPRLGLPALGGLFAARQCPDLDGAKLQNRHLLTAVFRLSWMRDPSGLSRVNWRDMGPEELGSVYESLLELEPEVSVAARRFRFSDGAAGNARKTTGSYYTPDSLVQVLLDSAFEPVVRETLAAHPDRPAEALLALTIVDPACGSGHFLLAAARRLAAHVARVEADGTPSAADYRHALRRVVGRCIYGVDLNPMAVELCTVALWMEAVEPGLPLGFLDAHIRCGNALVGATPALLEAGVPDDAWAPLDGDDKKVASALKKRNKAERGGQGTLVSAWSKGGAEGARLREAVRALEVAPDSDAAALAEKEAAWAALQASDAWRRQHLVADAWCAAFMWPKPAGGGPVVEAAPTAGLWRDLREGRGSAPPLLTETTAQLAAQHRFFHWHLAFPGVFERGGFDVVLGNPPWEQVELSEQEFFATRNPDIARAANAASRKRMIASLPDDDPVLWAEWTRSTRETNAQTAFHRNTTRFPLCAVGRVNTYALFAELYLSLQSMNGAVGCVLPAGIATDDNTKAYFTRLVSGQQLRALYHFENEERVFIGVNNMFRFVLLSLVGTARPVRSSELVLFARSPATLNDSTRRYTLSAREFRAVNPNTGTLPTFLTRRDADLNLTIYMRTGVLWREGPPEENPWGLRFMQGVFNMASDSDLFRTGERLRAEGWDVAGNCFVRGSQMMLPLFEAKMVHLLNSRYAGFERATQANLNKGTLPPTDITDLEQPTYLISPQSWVTKTEVEERLRGRWDRGWLLGWRDITNAHNERTVIASLIPRVAVGHKFPLLLPAQPAHLIASLYANLCSLTLDYAARQKVGGTSLTYFVLKQLPVLAPAAYAPPCPWDHAHSVADWLLPRVLELTYTAWDLEAFGRDVGWAGPPFRWDADRRALLRAELDAAFFHLYGLSRDGTDYILDTFPIVRKNDEKAHGEYRTKRLILEAYDAMAVAARSGRPYSTPLDPPPADPRAAHDPATRPAWAPELT